MSSSKILVVEDEGIVALSIRRSLERMGYDVIATVPSGEEAVEKAETEHIDLVLMDIRLKGALSGTEAAAQIKEHTEVPIIYLTAYSDEETLRKAKLAEPYGYLVKPYSDRELHAAVEMAIHNSVLERERREAEEAVRARDRLLQDLMDNSPNIVALRDLDGEYLHVNRAFERTFGIPRQDAIGKTIPEVVPLFAGPDLAGDDQRIRTSGESVEREVEWAAPQGRRVLLVSRFPLRKPDGAIYGVGTIATDITERRVAQEAVEASERRYRLLAENATDVIALSSPSGIIRYISPSSARLTGYRPEELIGTHSSDHLHPDDVARVLEAGRQSSPEPFTLLYRMRHRDGRFLWVESVVRTMADPDHETGELLLSVNRDVTGRVMAEAEADRLREDLERRVTERTRQLAAANEELQAFSYAVSHDLRAPLRAIKVYAEAMEEECGDIAPQPARMYLTKLREQAESLSLLVEDLLKLALTTRREIDVQGVDVSALATEVVAELRAGAPERAARIDIEPGLHARADPSLLRVALVNLLGNAWKYSSRRDEAVIRVGRVATPRGKAFFVEDNGIGFDPRKAGELFKPFRRLAAAQGFSGTGIGLSTVASVVRRHGGDVWAEGREGEGATFYFTLPEDARLPSR